MPKRCIAFVGPLESFRHLKRHLHMNWTAVDRGVYSGTVIQIVRSPEDLAGLIWDDVIIVDGSDPVIVREARLQVLSSKRGQ